MSLTLKKNVLEKFKNDVFIETGTYLGGGVNLAIECGFKEIISIEMSYFYYIKCKEMFKSNQNVSIHFGDSAKLLPSILQSVTKPATFWLDGHTIPGIKTTAQEGDGWTYCPLMLELDAIANHPIKTHTIMVDDMDAFGTSILDNIKVEDIISKLLSINPSYLISFEDGKSPKDILVATIS